MIKARNLALVVRKRITTNFLFLRHRQQEMVSQQSSDGFSVKAAETGQMTSVTKSNALRKAAKDKTLQLQDVEDKLNGKLEALKRS